MERMFRLKLSRVYHSAGRWLALLCLVATLGGCLSVKRDASLDRTERPHHAGVEAVYGTFTNQAAPDSSYASYTLMQFLLDDRAAYETVNFTHLKPDMLYVQATGGEGVTSRTVTLIPGRHFTIEEGQWVLPARHWPRWQAHDEPAHLRAYINAEGDFIVTTLVQRGDRYKGVVPFAESETRYWYFERLAEAAPAAQAK
ncbi:MAG: hypothetical protein ACFBZ8_09710 [Opitutales bacterium]